MRVWLPALFLLLALQSHSQADTVINKTTSASSATHFHWIYPAIAVSYAGLTYLVYRHFDTPIKEGWQSHRSHFQTAISKSVTNFGLGRVQTYGWIANTV